MPIEQVRELAEGRVYTGVEAQRLGLIDEIGGIEDAKNIWHKRWCETHQDTSRFRIEKTSIINSVRQFAMGSVLEPQANFSTWLTPQLQRPYKFF